MVAEHGCDMPWRAPQEQISERICEQIVDFQVPQNVEQAIEVLKISSQDRDLHGTVEQIPDILVPEMVEQLVKLPETVSDDKIQQRTAEHIAVISVPQAVKELVEVSEVFPQDRSQQYFLEQINETPDVSLAEKVFERPVTQTQQGVNIHAQHVVNAVEVEKPKIIELAVQRKNSIIQEKINQVIKHIKNPELQFTDKVVDNPVVAQKQISKILTVQKNIEISQLQVEDVPVVVVAQVPQVHVEMKTVEIPQLQVKAVDVPVVLVILVSQVQVVKKTVENSQFEIIEKLVENPVIDACLTCDAKCMVACESCVKDNMFMVPGEITVAGKIDIPRETLLQNKIFRVIKKTLMKKCLEMTRGSFVQGGAGTALNGNGSKRQQHTQGARQAAQKRESEVKQRGEQGREEREEGRKGQRGRDQEGRKEER